MRKFSLVSRLLFGLLASLHFSAQVFAATFHISPLIFRLSPDQKIATLTVFNNDQEPVRLQISALAWGTDGKEEVFTATKDLQFNPPIFSLDPGKKQILRFGFKMSQQAKSDQEQLYRLLITEIPGKKKENGSVLRTVLQLSVPVFISPKEKREALHWSLVQTPEKAWVLVAKNEGNVHKRITGLALHPAQQQEPNVLAIKEGRVYLLPGQQRQWLLAQAKPQLVFGQNLPKNIQVKIDTNEGSEMHDVAVDIPLLQ